MEGLVPVRDSEAVSIIEKETLHVDVDVHGFSDDFISEDPMKSNEETGGQIGTSNTSTKTTVSVVQKNLVTAKFAKMSNGNNKDVMDSPTPSDQEGETEDVVVLDEHLQSSNGKYKPGPKSKTRKSPPKLLPIEKGATSVNGESATNRDTPTRQAALKSAEMTKVMTQMKSRASGEDDMAVVDVSMGLRDSDATQVTIKKAADPSINHCLNCNKMDCLVYQTTGKYSKSELNFCSKRCVEQYFKHGEIHYVNSRDDSSSEHADSLSRTPKNVQQDIVIEPDIQTSPDMMDTSDDSGVTGINGTGAHVGVEAVVESAAREALICETCRVSLYDVNDPLVWEAKEYCSIKCLSLQLKAVGFSCNQCRARVGVSVLGKLCVRFGSSVRQFCSSPCLEKFKLNHKLCAQCQINMLNKDRPYCSLACEDLNRRLRNKTEYLGQHTCAVCCMKKQSREQINLNGHAHWLCSEPCRNAFRFANKTLTCGLCQQAFDSKSLPRYVSRNIEPGKAMELSDLTWFCSLTCHTTYLLKQRTIVSCVWCRVKKYSVDMIRKIMTAPPASQGPKDQRPQPKEAFFCSMYCMDLHQASAQPPKVPNKLSETAAVGYRMPNPALSTASIPSNPATGGIVTLPPSIHSTYSVAAPAVSATPAPTVPATVPSKNTSGNPSPCVPLEVLHKIITVPAQPKEMKNKSTWCRPMADAATGVDASATNSIQSQTEAPESAEKRLVFIPVPIPVPIYVPVPMGMFNSSCPKPFPFPLPIPTPVLFPVSPDKIPAIMETLKELKGDTSASNPLEEEILLLAEALGNSSQSESVVGDSAVNSKEPEHATVEEEEEDEREEDLEQALSSIKIVMMAPGTRKRSASDANSPVLSATPPAKRLRDSSRKNSISSSEGEDSEHAIAQTPFSQGGFQRQLGERAWKQWSRRRNLDQGKTACSKKLCRLSSMNIEEMNSNLVEFVRDIRKPNGDKYRPDVLLYFLYGLQLGLGTDKRHEKLFMDAALQPFQEELDRCLEPYCQSLTKAISEEKNASFSSCLRECHLWESQQLGVHTPFVLVFTMLYFNTKYFRLYTIEQHEQLSFTSVHKVNKKAVQVANSAHGTAVKGAQKISCLQLVHSTSPGPDIKIKKPLDQPQNLDRPTECPIKHYNFYLSKCPDSVRMRKDVYYLVPETSCTPDSPVWYSTQPVPRQILSRMLRRVLLVEDVLQNLCV